MRTSVLQSLQQNDNFKFQWLTHRDLKLRELRAQMTSDFSSERKTDSWEVVDFSSGVAQTKKSTSTTKEKNLENEAERKLFPFLE